YSLGHIGMKKTQALVEVIRSINPFIDLEVIDTKINRDNIMDIVKGQQIICEALDDPATKSMVVSEVLANSNDKLVIAASGMAGLGDANLIRTQKKFSRLYICGDERSDFELTPGMMAPRVSICAGHQANIILRLIMGLEG
ncbi:sulfur carrier protein ThiS adenylyltransferase ThiF, partial [Salmonella enterica subsp. enterica serovar Tamberma]|nr:sulfur carrier protein ThiS adenylyltransferase ThiF [Salmonella enterica subsp. enterica serovar Tamberma]